METLTYLGLCNLKVLFYLGQVLVPDRRVLQCCSHCDGGKGVCLGMVVVHSSATHHNARVANYYLLSFRMKNCIRRKETAGQERDGVQKK